MTIDKPIVQPAILNAVGRDGSKVQRDRYPVEYRILGFRVGDGGVYVWTEGYIYNNIWTEILPSAQKGTGRGGDRLER